MPVPLVDLKAQHHSLKKELEAAFRRVTADTAFILGKEVDCFEKEFAAFCQTPHAVSCASGTDALVLALRALGIGRGDEVLTVPFTWISTTLSILAVGATPVFVDVDPQTYGMDPNDLKKRLTRRARAILPVHLYGHAAPMDAIRSFAAKNGLLLIEDAAQAHGALWNDRPPGSSGDAACYSFYPSKNLGALGDGGMVTVRDARLAEKLRLLRNYGQRDKNKHLLVGTNSRLDTLQAALLRVKLRRLARWTEMRRAAAARYGRVLRSVRCKLPVEARSARHVYHCYVVQVERRDAVLKALWRAGVLAQVHYPTPVHRQPCFRGERWARVRMPVSETAARRVISLPMYPEITEAQQMQVARALRHATA